jgi:hypothetical protein
MRTALEFIVALFALVVTALSPATVAGQARGSASGPAIPESIQTEHHAIHEALTNATRAPGAVGAAAKELAALLDPHFKREEEIALPPLGLLAPLAAGQKPAGMEKVLAMSDALRKELPRMLEEHQRIRAATERLRLAAREQKLAEHERFAEELALHAQTEEEVLYPAAVLVGDIIRARLAQK